MKKGKTFHTFNLNRLITHVTNVGYNINRIFTPWCQNSYCKVPILNRKTYSIAMGTNHHLAALNKLGSHVAPWGPTPIFFRGYESSLHLQTFLLSHRAMFKHGGKKLFVLCLLVKNVSAVDDR